MCKKKFSETKFGSWAKKHILEITTVGVAVGVGVAGGVYFRNEMRKTFNTGFWSGFEFGGEYVMTTVAVTDEGKEAILKAQGANGTEYITEETIEVAAIMTESFMAYCKKYKIEKTMPSHGAPIYVPYAQKRS